MTSDVYPLSGYKLFGNLSLRVNESDPDKLMFVARDVAVALGYKKPQNAVARHCKGASKRGILTPGGEQQLTLIPESDVYRLMAHSKLDSAQEFEHRVFEEILPTIRKHGMYATPDTLDRMLDDPDFGIKMLETVKAEREKSAALEAEIVKQKPKVEYAETTTENMTRFKLTEIAVTFNMTRKLLTKWLVAAGILTVQHHPTQRRFLPTTTAIQNGWTMWAKDHRGCVNKTSYRFTKEGFDEVRRVIINNQEVF